MMGGRASWQEAKGAPEWRRGSAKLPRELGAIWRGGGDRWSLVGAEHLLIPTNGNGPISVAMDNGQAHSFVARSGEEGVKAQRTTTTETN